MDEILYTYLADGNTRPDGSVIATLPGVPLRDLTAADVADLPAHLVASLVPCGLYAAVSAPPPDDGEEG